MLRRLRVVRVQAELSALEACAERAGMALACVYSSADEFEAARRDAGRAAQQWLPHHVDRLRLVLAATALTAVGALVAVLARVAS